MCPPQAIVSQDNFCPQYYLRSTLSYWEWSLRLHADDMQFYFSVTTKSEEVLIFLDGGGLSDKPTEIEFVGKFLPGMGS